MSGDEKTSDADPGTTTVAQGAGEEHNPQRRWIRHPGDKLSGTEREIGPARLSTARDHRLYLGPRDEPEKTR